MSRKAATWTALAAEDAEPDEARLRRRSLAFVFIEKALDSHAARCNVPVQVCAGNSSGRPQGRQPLAGGILSPGTCTFYWCSLIQFRLSSPSKWVSTSRGQNFKP